MVGRGMRYATTLNLGVSLFNDLPAPARAAVFLKDFRALLRRHLLTVPFPESKSDIDLLIRILNNEVIEL